MIASIAVLGKNSRWILRYSLKSIRRAVEQVDGEKVEILYIDGGSTDGSPQLVRELMPEARVIDAAGTNIPEARNIAVREAAGDYVIFWDSDVIAPPCALRALLSLKAPIAALARRDVTVSSEADIEKAIAALPDCRTEPANLADFAVFSVNLFRRDVFREVGPFDERMTQAEDREFGLRATCRGYRTLIIPTPAYDINRPRLSEVPVGTPLRQYLRGMHKKALVLPTLRRHARRSTQCCSRRST